jgi:hypothetical protein
MWSEDKESVRMQSQNIGQWGSAYDAANLFPCRSGGVVADDKNWAVRFVGRWDSELA